jgi:hypothetical protein
VTHRPTEAASRERRHFEQTFAKYVNALDALDNVTERIAEQRRRDKHATRIFRTLRCRKHDVARLATILRTRYALPCATEVAA